MEIKPFKGFRFDPKVVGDAGDCIAPPFDVIGPAEQQKLYEKSEYNIVRITKGKTTPIDDRHNNQYTRAADYLAQWIKTGVLKQDSKEVIYAYVQDFLIADAKYQRISFIALTKLEEFGPKVRPHEEVFEKPVNDRLNLTLATSAQFGLVFMLYQDEQKISEQIIESIAEQTPLADFTFEDIRQRLFAIKDRSCINAIVRMMSDKSCIIADGHHRYTTGLAYSKQNASPAAGYQMISFANICQDGLRLLATHRIIGELKNFNIVKFIADLKNDFDVTELPFSSAGGKAAAYQKMITQIQAEYNNDKSAFGIYGGNDAFYAAVLKNNRAMDSAVAGKSDAWKSLDVSVLHKLVLKKLLGIDEKQLIENGIVEYVKGIPNDINDSISLVDSGQKQVLFLLNPVKMQQLQMITVAGERMPHKSTYFYPKMYTGLVIQKI